MAAEVWLAITETGVAVRGEHVGGERLVKDLHHARRGALPCA